MSRRSAMTMASCRAEENRWRSRIFMAIFSGWSSGPTSTQRTRPNCPSPSLDLMRISLRVMSGLRVILKPRKASPASWSMGAPWEARRLGWLEELRGRPATGSWRGSAACLSGGGGGEALGDDGALGVWASRCRGEWAWLPPPPACCLRINSAARATPGSDRRRRILGPVGSNMSWPTPEVPDSPSRALRCRGDRAATRS
mmetsp:Transcript_19020/g.55317  ORF Transcript_19020/g.55317 Transcript_19020/m.55317 type:complete len:200 (-) Transcript_19020:740-1339(-)